MITKILLSTAIMSITTGVCCFIFFIAKDNDLPKIIKVTFYSMLLAVFLTGILAVIDIVIKGV